MCGSKDECLLNYSGLTFTVSLWKAEQAFVMSYKPLNEKAHNLQLQSAANRSDRWAVFWDWRRKDRGCGTLVCRRFTGNRRFGAFCWKLTKHFIVCKEQTTAGWDSEVIQDLIFCKIRPEWRVVQWLLYLGFSSILFLLLTEVHDLNEHKQGQWEKNNEGRHGEALRKENDWLWQDDGLLTDTNFLDFYCLRWSVRQEEYMLCFTVCVRLWERAKVPDGVCCPRLPAKWDDYVKTAHVTITIISGIHSIGTA